MIDANGTQVVEYHYDAWGNPVAKTGSMADTLGTVNPFRYRGYVYDEETGLYYLKDRYYNPLWKRFISADEKSKTGNQLLGANLYVYCLNNPIVMIDRNGDNPSAITLISEMIATLAAATAGITGTALLLWGVVSIALLGLSYYAVDVTLSNLAYVKEQAKIIEQADSKIKRIIRKDLKERYWSANLRRGYIDIGRNLTFNQAVKMVSSGSSVFTGPLSCRCLAGG